MTCESGPVRRGSDPLKMRRLAVEKQTDFASFRRFLGAGSMPVDPISRAPGQTLAPSDAVVTARLPKFKSLDPQSIGISMMGLGTTPFSYDPRDGSITVVLREALNTVKGKYQHALIWATEAKSGRRVEASLLVRFPDPAIQPVPVPDPAAIVRTAALATTQAVLPAPAIAPPATAPTPAVLVPTTAPAVPAGGSADGKAAHVALRHSTQP